MKIRSFLFGSVFAGLAVSNVAASTPAWLWSKESASSSPTFSYRFELPGEPGEALLTVTSDFASVDVLINDKEAGRLEAYDPVTPFPITPFLREGANEIRLLARGVDGPSAVAAELRYRNGEGREKVVPTGSNLWEAEGVIEKGAVLPARWAPRELPDVSPSAEYNQWKEALADSSARSLSPMPPGFSLSLVRRAREDEDSWVSMVRDPAGRLIIAREDRGLLRFTLDADRREVIRSELINRDLEECRGLAFRGKTLYANANDSKALYRLRDTTGDDLYDEVIEIQATTGSVGHGRNDLVLGPDGAIHSIHGDSVETPARTTFLTAPEDSRSRPLGHWLTIGSGDNEWSLLARGLRNPYGIDFNSHGEAFTYDADNEGDVGLPFYRPSRINHLVEGANYGWHQRPGNTRSLPVYAPDSLPTTFDVGRGSPTGVKFVPKGHWSPAWDDVLLALDWAYGRIVAVTPVPRGAGYYASGSLFLEGRPLNVTDLEFDDGGSLWFVTGGRRTRSALYRIDFDPRTTPANPGLQSAQAAARDEFSSARRVLRKELLSQQGPIAESDLSWKYLGSKDPRLRHAARIRLERRPTREWAENLESLEDRLAILTGALALARQGEERERRASLALARTLPSSGWSRTQQLTFLRIGELVASSEPLTVSESDAIASRALGWISSPEAPVTREAVRLLALLDRPETIGLARELGNRAQTQPDQLFYLEMLSRVTRGWTETTRTAFFKSIAATKQVARGDRFLPPFFEALEEEALSALPEPERESWSALLEPETEPGETGTTQRAFVRNWSVEDFKESDFAHRAAVAPGKGAALFRATLCHRCHLFGREGIPIGPDLTRAGSRYSGMDLLQSILEPSSIVAEVYRNVSVETASGETITGRLVRDDFRQSLLYLSTDPFDPVELVQIPKNEIRSIIDSEISPMPPGLLSSLEKEEVIALIQWLRTPPAND